MTGENCTEDINGCADNPCLNSTCIDIAADEEVDLSYVCTTVTCPDGYTKISPSDSTDECFGELERGGYETLIGARAMALIMIIFLIFYIACKSSFGSET